ncbi:MAG: hypothetical protein AB1571_03155 [Nanoarchaeota archaeon]
MIFLFGLLDIVSAIFLIILYYKTFNFVVIFAVYLMVKIFIFWDLVSLVDFLAGVSIIIALFGFQTIALWIFALWLLQKGIFSLFR